MTYKLVYMRERSKYILDMYVLVCTRVYVCMHVRMYESVCEVASVIVLRVVKNESMNARYDHASCVQECICSAYGLHTSQDGYVVFV